MRLREKRTSGSSGGSYPSTTSITLEDFTYAQPDGRPSEKNSRVAYMRRYPDQWLMIRPDMGSPSSIPYANSGERERGEEAKRKWFAYLDAKGFRSVAGAWRGMLAAGLSLQVVCDDPADFDVEYSA